MFTSLNTDSLSHSYDSSHTFYINIFIHHFFFNITFDLLAVFLLQWVNNSFVLSPNRGSFFNLISLSSNFAEDCNIWYSIFRHVKIFRSWWIDFWGKYSVFSKTFLSMFYNFLNCLVNVLWFSELSIYFICTKIYRVLFFLSIAFVLK